MLLFIEFLIVGILISVLIALYVDERRTKYQKVPLGKMTGYWNGKERRRDIRIDKVLTVRYMVEKKPHLIKNGLTKNIGRGGILVETNEKLVNEALLGLEIEIPDRQKPIDADGKVVWVKEISKVDETGRRIFDVGIKFVYMAPDENEFLLQYINKLTP